MNTVAWIAGCVASFWLAVYAFNTMGEQELGFAMIAVFFVCLLNLALAITDDVRILVGREK